MKEEMELERRGRGIRRWGRIYRVRCKEERLGRENTEEGREKRDEKRREGIGRGYLRGKNRK